MKDLIKGLLEGRLRIKQLLRQWYNYLANNLKKAGFNPIFTDQAVFKNNILGIIILCHVDNLLVFGPNII